MLHQPMTTPTRASRSERLWVHFFATGRVSPTEGSKKWAQCEPLLNIEFSLVSFQVRQVNDLMIAKASRKYFN